VTFSFQFDQAKARIAAFQLIRLEEALIYAEERAIIPTLKPTYHRAST